MKLVKKIAPILLALSFATALAGCGKGLEPTIKEGRFDFSVTYEVDGVQESIAGVFVCEFVETVKAVDGWYIEWNSYVEDSQLQNRLEENRGYLLLKTCADGNISLDFNLSAKYFMADPNYGNSNANTDESLGISPCLFMEYSDAKGEELGEWWSEDTTVLESYGVRLIGYEYATPIENIYK